MYVCAERIGRYRLGVNGLGPLDCKVLIAIPFYGASVHGWTGERFLGFRGTGSASWELHNFCVFAEGAGGDEKLRALSCGCVRTYMPFSLHLCLREIWGKSASVCVCVRERESERGGGERGEMCGRERQCSAQKERFGPESA